MLPAAFHMPEPTAVLSAPVPAFFAAVVIIAAEHVVEDPNEPLPPWQMAAPDVVGIGLICMALLFEPVIEGLLAVTRIELECILNNIGLVKIKAGAQAVERKERQLAVHILKCSIAGK